MKLSFATLGCPAWNLKQIAENARAMGFDGVELRGSAGEHIGPDESPESRAAIKSLFAANGVKIACIMGYSRFTWDEPEKRDENVAAAIKMLGVARDVGCPTLRIFGGNRSPNASFEENLKRVIESIRKITPTAQKMGVKLALETHDDWCKGANIAAVLKGVDSPWLGICWDISNAWWIEPLDETYDSVKDHLVHVHFKDSRKNAEGHIESTLPGTGQVDMAKGLALLKRAGYNGWLSFEWEKKWEPRLEEPEIAFPTYMKHATKLMAAAGVKRG